MWYLAPGSKSCSVRATGADTPWYLVRSAHQALVYSEGGVFPLNTSQVTPQALASPPTSRARGLVSIDRSQNVFGRGSSPIEVKNASPVFTTRVASHFCATSAPSTSRLATPLYGSTSG